MAGCSVRSCRGGKSRLQLPSPVTARSAPVLDHLSAFTDDVGLFQHARRDVPSRKHGYCTDDIARALIVTCDAANARPSADVNRLFTVYLAFLVDAQLHDGWFHNFMGYDRRWQDRRGGEDTLGRALWGLGYAAAHAPRASWRAAAADLIRPALEHVGSLVHLRARAYAALGLAQLVETQPADVQARGALRSAAGGIAAAYREVADSDWAWCEPTMTYDNARLCEALLRAGMVLKDPELVRIGREMLDFYAGVTIEDGTFVPIGNEGWNTRGGLRARFGQQPLEAAGLVDAGMVASAATGDGWYRSLAQVAYAWFFGRNLLGAVLVENGGCHDGIDERGVNANMGAESTLAYLMSAFVMVRDRPQALRIAR
jgi:hypothetical protein